MLLASLDPAAEPIAVAAPSAPDAGICVPDASRARLWAMIDPSAAARSLAPAGPGIDVGPTAEERGRALSADLGRAAAQKGYVTRRPPPRLQHRRDGSYVYEGVG